MRRASESSDVTFADGGELQSARPRTEVVASTASQSRHWWQRTSGLRSLASDPTQGGNGSAQLAVSAALVVPAWVALGIAAVVISSSNIAAESSQASITMLSTLAGELAVGAAVLSIVRAWAVREVAPALAGAGFLAYGIHKLVPASTASSQGSGSTGQSLGSACLVLAFGLVLLAVVHRPEAARSRHPLAFWAAALVVALTVLTITRPAGSGILSDAGSAGTAGNLIIAGAWSALGLAAIYVGRSERVQLKIWIGFTAICLAQARIAYIVIGSPALAVIASAVLQAIAIALTLLGTMRALQETIAGNQGLIRDSLLAFQRSEARRRKESHAHEEAVHNIRSAVTSIGTATHLLVTDRDVPLSPDERSQLAAALQAELERARRLLSSEWDGGRRSFPLLDVLTPVVVNEQSQGTVIDLAVTTDTKVLANPERTYEVFATLFENARRHAPGATVTLRATSADGWVTVVVEDRGPGLPASSTDRIFERGWSTSARREGMGLGLYVARRLMEDQGGQLTATNRRGGGASFLVGFPAGDAVVTEASRALGHSEVTTSIDRGELDDAVPSQSLTR